jgi:hypothetical protein
MEDLKEGRTLINEHQFWDRDETSTRAAISTLFPQYIADALRSKLIDKATDRLLNESIPGWGSRGGGWSLDDQKIVARRVASSLFSRIDSPYMSKWKEEYH